MKIASVCMDTQRTLGGKREVVISLVVDEHRIPITHKVWKGNTVDKKAFSETVKELKDRFGISRAILFADRGCISRDIIESIEKNNLEYIVGMKMNLLEVKEALLQEGEYSKVSDNLYVKEVKVDNRRYIVCFNPEEAAYEKEKRANIIEHLREVTNVKNFIPNREIKKLIKLESNRITIDEEKVKEIEKYDGMWVLLTNTTLQKSEVAEHYKEL